MLGWEIHIINNATGQEYGDWLTGHKGKDWIEQLVDKGIAEKFYSVASSHYLIKAKDLKPLIIPSHLLLGSGLMITLWTQQHCRVVCQKS